MAPTLLMLPEESSASRSAERGQAPSFGKNVAEELGPTGSTVRMYFRRPAEVIRPPAG
ncbi:hypothetical protein [Streptomyces sp. NBC_00996]|uniref:hypothetical protein n=1 Tax=Streptomyces sp. NBC_00996 TaxID=2903710 RepID=UPI003868359D|nr:hypothetical protein OG390_05600 [Streptomyces sp. NBC_00996]